MTEKLIIALLMFGGALLTACAGWGGADAPDFARLGADLAGKSKDWIMSPEGQAYLQVLIGKVAPSGPASPDPTLLAGGLGSVGAALLLGVKNWLDVRSERSKSSRKRGEQWEAIKELKNGKGS